MSTVKFPHLIQKDLLIEAKGVAIKEWWVANKHLIEEDSKRPPVDCLVMTTRLQKFKLNPYIVGASFLNMLTSFRTHAMVIFTLDPKNLFILNWEKANPDNL